MRRRRADRGGDIRLKVTQSRWNEMQDDLARPHPFAAERVGFLACRFGRFPPFGLVILVEDYYPVADTDYVDDQRYGALIGSNAIRFMMQLALDRPVGVFHVHQHAHSGRPTLSPIDRVEMAKLVPDLFHVRPNLPHGAIIISTDRAVGRCWLPGNRSPRAVTSFHVVGRPLVSWRNAP